MLELLKKTVTNILNNTKNPISEFQTFLNESGWPISFNKDSFIKTLQNMIDEKLDIDPEDALIDLLTYTSREAKKLNSKQRKLLQEIVQNIKDAKIKSCKHEKFGVALFLHGGGFTPVIALPELICTSCGLNLTITSNISKKTHGIIIRDKKKLIQWAVDSFQDSTIKRKGIPWVEDVLKNPIEKYKQSNYIFPNDLKFQVTDYQKLQSKSGT
jgi:hypothetical protein